MQEQARAELLIEAAAFSRVEVAPPCSVPKLLHSSGVTVSLHVTPSGPILTVSNCASSKQRSKTVPADWKRPRSTEGSFASLALTRKDLELVAQRRAPRAKNSVRRKPLACALADGVMRRDNKADGDILSDTSPRHVSEYIKSFSLPRTPTRYAPHLPNMKLNAVHSQFASRTPTSMRQERVRSSA